MRKKLLSTLLATAMAVTMLAGCGSNGGQQATTPATDNKTETSAEAKTETSAEAKTETSGATGGGKVGVAMPTKDLQRYSHTGIPDREYDQLRLRTSGHRIHRR